MGLVALTLILVAPVVVNRLDDYFRVQEEQSLRAQAEATAAILDRFIADTVGTDAVVINVDGKLQLNPAVRLALVDDNILDLAAHNVAHADIRLRFGLAHQELDGPLAVDPDPTLGFDMPLSEDPARGQLRDPSITPATADVARANAIQDWGMSVTLSNPYTSRANTCLLY